MKKRHVLRKAILLFFSLFLVIQVYSQERTITGTVKDANDGSPLPGATVVVKGTTTGTATNFAGEFSIEAENGDVLVVSFVGYESQEIAITDQTSVEVNLQPSAFEVDEVVVIGYGTVSKEDATGSVVAVDSREFNRGAISSPQELLMGKASGVVITTGNGAAGSDATIRIRGGSSLTASNDPLIVIDGIPIDSRGIGGMANPLSTINPNDIETFTVLKDASATAIYGSRASNGVIIITTKRGRVGDTRVTYNGDVSIGMPIEYVDVFDGDEFRSLVQDRVDNYGLTSEALTKLGDANTDWQEQIYRNAISTDHSLAISGGIKDVPYRLSVGFLDDNGILKYNKMQRTTADLSLSPVLLDGDLKIDFNAKGAYTFNNFSNDEAIFSATQFDPTQPIKNGNTRYGGYTAWVESSAEDQLNGLPNNIATHNPVARLEYRDNTSDAYRYLVNLQADYNVPFLPGLKAVMKVGYDYYKTDGHDITDTLASWSYREPEQNVKTYENERINGLFDFYLNYKGTFGTDHDLDATAGYSYQSFYTDNLDTNRPWGMTLEEYGKGISITRNELFLVSFFGRANYGFMNKYLLTATVRFDGSSRFSEGDNRWGIFPAFAFAWKIDQESFMEGFDALSNLKLRLGYGVTGQQDIGDRYYPYIPVYTSSEAGAYYQFGNNFYPTLRPDPYNPSIKWEETTTQNIALDFGFLNQRITGTIDLYKRVTDDLLNEVKIPAGTNFSNFLVTNVGSLENTGVEAELGVYAISQADMSWRISTNFTYNQNEITKLTLVDDPDYTGFETGGISGGVGNNVQVNNTGFPARTFHMFDQVYDVNGMPIEGLYVDKTGEGGVVSGNNANKYYLGNPSPDYQVGISSYFTYGKFDFSFSGRMKFGNWVYNNIASQRAIYQEIYNQSGYAANILTAVNKTRFQTAQFWSDFYLENGSFFRMDNITLGYSFDRIFTDKLNGRVNFTVQNAFLITDYSGLDPEIENGIDDNFYPRPRTFLFGVNLNL